MKECAGCLVFPVGPQHHSSFRACTARVLSRKSRAHSCWRDSQELKAKLSDFLALPRRQINEVLVGAGVYIFDHQDA